MLISATDSVGMTVGALVLKGGVEDGATVAVGVEDGDGASVTAGVGASVTGGVRDGASVTAGVGASVT
jgi:hypothetical protein